MLVALLASSILTLPAFPPLRYPDNFSYVQIAAALLSAVLIGLSFNRKLIGVLFLGAFALPFLLIANLCLFDATLYAWLIALEEAPSCHSVPMLGNASVLAVDCTEKNNYLILRGTSSLASLRRQIAKTQEEGRHVDIVELIQNTFYVKAGRADFGMLLEYDAPLFSCDSMPKVSPLFIGLLWVLFENLIR